MKWKPDCSMPARVLRAMKTSRTIQYVAAAVLASIGCVGMLEHSHLLALPLNLAPMVLMSRSELTRPVPREEAPGVLMGLLIVLLCLGAMVVLLKFLIPDVANGRGITNPAFVIPFWALMMLVLFWRWRRERRMTRA